MAEQPGDRAGLALAPLARGAIDTAAMFAELAIPVVQPCRCNDRNGRLAGHDSKASSVRQPISFFERGLKNENESGWVT